MARLNRSQAFEEYEALVKWLDASIAADPLVRKVVAREADRLKSKLIGKGKVG